MAQVGFGVGEVGGGLDEAGGQRRAVTRQGEASDEYEVFGEDEPQLQRTSTDYEIQDDDRIKIWTCTALFVGPAVSIWYFRWLSWNSRLAPELDAMLSTARRFSSDHPILLDDGVDEFKRSRDNYLSAILGVQESFKARFGELMSDGEVTDPTSIMSSVVFSVALIYILMFLPDASICLSKEKRTHRLICIPLSAVRQIRICFLALLSWQLYAVYSALGTMYQIAKTMEDNSVKELRVLGSTLLRQREKYPPEDYNLLPAETLVGIRWGLRLRVWPGVISFEKGWVIDVQFFHEFRFNAILIAIFLSILAYVLWERIRGEREKQGKSSRSLLDKLLFREKQKRVQLEDRHKELKKELKQTRSRLSSRELKPQLSVGSRVEGLDGDTIPFQSLEFEQEIDRGGYGVVYQGKWKGNVVAIKKIEMKESDMKRVELEAAIFLSLKHPHLVSCYGMSESPGVGLQSPSLCIVTEWCKFGSLDHLLHTPAKQISPEKMLQWMSEIASGMGHLHSHKVWHRDLKSANVLIDKNRVCRLCDYGVSKLMVHHGSPNDWSGPEMSTPTMGTPDYMPPEVLAGKADSGMSSDTYSYGVLINEMACRQRPWSHLHIESPGARPYAITLEVSRGGRPQLARDLNPAFHALLQECWAEDPEKRPAFDGDGDSSVIARIRSLTAFTRVAAKQKADEGSAVPAYIVTTDGTKPQEPEPQKDETQRSQAHPGQRSTRTTGKPMN